MTQDEKERACRERDLKVLKLYRSGLGTSTISERFGISIKTARVAIQRASKIEENT